MANRGWFEVQQFPDDVTMIREPHHDEDVKVYLVEGTRDVAVLDTGSGAGDFAGLVASLSSKRPRVLQTHANWDHFGASHRFSDVLVHPSEVTGLRAGCREERYRAAFAPEHVEAGWLPPGFDPTGGLPGCEATGWLEDGDMIDLGGRVLEVIHTPGHSPGGVSFLDRQARALFAGDLLYLGAMYIFFPDSDPAAFLESLRRVVALNSAYDTVYPAHGPSPLPASDVIAIRDAFDVVWSGRAPEREGALFGLDITVHDFGRFSFCLPPSGWRALPAP